MTQEQINQWNEKISYQDGKIIERLNKGITSVLLENLTQKFGYYVCKSGAITILKDDKGATVTSAPTRAEFLYNVALVMR